MNAVVSIILRNSTSGVDWTLCREITNLIDVRKQKELILLFLLKIALGSQFKRLDNLAKLFLTFLYSLNRVIKNAECLRKTARKVQQIGHSKNI